ncbi:hypothetical protein C8R44DRAFT_985673 [Mycena epipterygia]|nr:hypothetical protein C8R44DRAFT_985673 [Mycena epipterygia]
MREGEIEQKKVAIGGKMVDRKQAELRTVPIEELSASNLNGTWASGTSSQSFTGTTYDGLAAASYPNRPTFPLSLSSVLLTLLDSPHDLHSLLHSPAHSIHSPSHKLHSASHSHSLHSPTHAMRAHSSMQSLTRVTPPTASHYRASPPVADAAVRAHSPSSHTLTHTHSPLGLGLGLGLGVSSGAGGGGGGAVSAGRGAGK